MGPGFESQRDHKLGYSNRSITLQILYLQGNCFYGFVKKQASAEADRDKPKFLELFDEYVKQPVISNPSLLRRKGWYYY